MGTASNGGPSSPDTTARGSSRPGPSNHPARSISARSRNSSAAPWAGNNGVRNSAAHVPGSCRSGLPSSVVAANGKKHPLGLMEGATENAAVAAALIDNLIERGLDPTVCRLFIVDGAKALSKAIRRTFT